MEQSLNAIAEHIAYEFKDSLNVELKENIKFSVKYWRSTLIRRDVARNGMSTEFLQRYYFDLIPVDKADACNFTLDCQILRSKYPLPIPIRLNGDSSFKFLGSVVGKSWTMTEYEEVQYTLHNKFTAQDVRVAIINNYAYVFGNTKLRKGMTEAAWADPSVINNDCEGNCYNDDMPFPIASDMLQQIVDGILTREFKIMNPKDNEVEIDTENNKVQE